MTPAETVSTSAPIHGVMELPGGEVLRGSFRDGLPHGECEYFDPEDKTTLVGIYDCGQLNGPAVQLDETRSRLVFRGSFQKDLRVGLAEVYDDYGGCVIGEVDGAGEHSGDNIMYVFPDGLTALVGTFQEGEFQRGRYATVLHEGLATAKLTLEGVNELCMPEYVLSQIPEVHRDVSTREKLCNQPLVPDLYEELRVEVRKSRMNSEMDGLFARRSLKAGELCSWYNGLRCTHEEVDARDWRWNDATMTLDAETVLDVPAAFVPVDAFTACLGHKANHHKPNNATYDVFDHPRLTTNIKDRMRRRYVLFRTGIWTVRRTKL